MYFNEIKIGMTVDIAPSVIDKDKMLAFARDYDNVPIHTDEEYAKSSHFGKIIAPGVMSFMSVWAKYLEGDFFGEELLAGKSTKIEWLKPAKQPLQSLLSEMRKMGSQKCLLMFLTRTESLY